MNTEVRRAKISASGTVRDRAIAAARGSGIGPSRGQRSPAVSTEQPNRGRGRGPPARPPPGTPAAEGRRPAEITYPNRAGSCGAKPKATSTQSAGATPSVGVAVDRLRRRPASGRRRWLASPSSSSGRAPSHDGPSRSTLTPTERAAAQRHPLSTTVPPPVGRGRGTEGAELRRSRSTLKAPGQGAGCAARHRPIRTGRRTRVARSGRPASRSATLPTGRSGTSRPPARTFTLPQPARSGPFGGHAKRRQAGHARPRPTPTARVVRCAAGRSAGQARLQHGQAQAHGRGSARGSVTSPLAPTTQRRRRAAGPAHPHEVGRRITRRAGASRSRRDGHRGGGAPRDPWLGGRGRLPDADPGGVGPAIEGARRTMARQVVKAAR